MIGVDATNLFESQTSLFLREETNHINRTEQKGPICHLPARQLQVCQLRR